MGNLRFNGVLEEIKERYPNIDLIHFLQQKLQLSDYKAEQLAARIEKQFFQKENNKTERKFLKTVLQKTSKPKISSEKSAYSVDCLSGKEFEFFIVWLFDELGYEVPSEKHSTCFGFDFVAEKDGEIATIQARSYPKTYIVQVSMAIVYMY